MRAPYNRPKGTLKPPKTPRKHLSLIANEMRSPANATNSKRATYDFLIANEFHFAPSVFRVSLFDFRLSVFRRLPAPVFEAPPHRHLPSASSEFRFSIFGSRFSGDCQPLFSRLRLTAICLLRVPSFAFRSSDFQFCVGE